MAGRGVGPTQRPRRPLCSCRKPAAHTHSGRRAASSCVLVPPRSGWGWAWLTAPVRCTVQLPPGDPLALAHAPAGALLPARPEAAFRGSTTYASVHAHAGADLGRRDDLWSWLYCLVELAQGGGMDHCCRSAPRGARTVRWMCWAVRRLLCFPQARCPGGNRPMGEAHLLRGGGGGGGGRGATRGCRRLLGRRARRRRTARRRRRPSRRPCTSPSGCSRGPSPRPC